MDWRIRDRIQEACGLIGLALLALTLFQSPAWSDEFPTSKETPSSPAQLIKAPAPVTPSAEDAVQPDAAIAPDPAETLEQKVARLQKLQDEILGLGGSISHATQIRITVRMIEIDVRRLQESGLANPFLPETDDEGAKREPMAANRRLSFASDAELMKSLEPTVASRCTFIPVDSVVNTSIGSSTSVTFYPERLLDHQEPGNDAVNQPVPIERRNAITIGVWPKRMMEDRILLRIMGRVAEQDLNNAVTINGRVAPGISARGFRSMISLKPGAPFTVSIAQTNERETYWIVTPEILAAEKDK